MQMHFHAIVEYCGLNCLNIIIIIKKKKIYPVRFRTKLRMKLECGI